MKEVVELVMIFQILHMEELIWDLSALDFAYPKKPDNNNASFVIQLTTMIIIQLQMNLYKFQIYNQTILLPEEVPYIIQREYQPIAKTFIKTIQQKEKQLQLNEKLGLFLNLLLKGNFNLPF